MTKETFIYLFMPVLRESVKSGDRRERKITNKPLGEREKKRKILTEKMT